MCLPTDYKIFLEQLYTIRLNIIVVWVNNCSVNLGEEKPMAV